MDKIQDAIAKARAARESGGSTAPLAPAVAPSVSPNTTNDAHTPKTTTQTSASVTANWDALPQMTPSSGRLKRNRIVALEGGREATDFDVLRTRVLQQARANNWRRIAITSPGPGCGKSTVGLNLAFSLARQADQRTLVAEMDMRRPSLAKALGIKEPNNFSAVLRGEAPFEEHAMRLDRRLVFATNQRSVSNPAELLQSEQAAQVLDDIEARYAPTISLFDMPPLLAGDDTMAFLSRVDCVILIAAAEQSSIKQVDTCEREIARLTNVMGVILNKCRYMDRDRAYGYYE